VFRRYTLAGEGGSKGGTGGGSSGAGVGGGSGGKVGETAAETPPCTSEELTRLVRAAVAAAAGGEDSARAIDALKALKKVGAGVWRWRLSGGSC
jgi:hypothetical protein